IKGGLSSEHPLSRGDLNDRSPLSNREKSSSFGEYSWSDNDSGLQNTLRRLLFGLRTWLHFVGDVFIEDSLAILKSWQGSCRKPAIADSIKWEFADATKQCGQSATQVGQVCGYFLPNSHYLIPIFALKICAQNHSFRSSRIVPVQNLKGFHQYSRLKIAHALFDPHFIESVACLLARTLPKKCDS
ncbi:MAG: hypothetical protein ACTHMB_19995, partial [Candidatus Binatia bacterium]